MPKTTYFCGQILVDLRDMKKTGEFCKKFIFNICKCTSNLSVILSDKEGNWTLL